MTDSSSGLLAQFEALYQKQQNNRMRVFLTHARIPIILFLLCLSISTYFGYLTITSILATSQANTQDDTVFVRESPLSLSDISTPNIFVDLSGSVVRPQTYAITEGTRLFELLEMAGGLSAHADHGYIQRNYNLSIVLTDQQKIHIPSIYEVRDGYFIEKRRLVSLDTEKSTNIQYQDNPNDVSSISINNASQKDLEVLPGVGPVTAQRIIAGRPYESLEDLTKREIVKQSLYENIIEFLTL